VGTETLTNHKAHSGRTIAGPPPADEETLRKLAFEQLERIRTLKIRVAAFFLGLVILGPIWVVTEYMNADGWPQRLSDNSQPGDWNPWIIWVALVGAFVVGVSALKVYFGRPTTEAEVKREVERLRTGR
jgi:hypothetical protein